MLVGLRAIFRSVGFSAGRWTVARLFAGMLGGLGFSAYDCVALSRQGRTFGTAIMKIRVAPVAGTPLTTADLAKRALFYPGPVIVKGIPAANLLAGILGFAVCLFFLIERPRERDSHDRVVGTRVVKDQR
ncbi:RDD family protein [Nonomuraea sp. NPDC046570]|uniref:RDD family protein n=1 Tax=Nonomuraea sp. NPDC046570 TaxID=3155255 RepID=UPI0033E2F2A2